MYTYIYIIYTHRHSHKHIFVGLTKAFCACNSITISPKYFLDICILATTNPDVHQRLPCFPEAFSILISISL